MYLPLSYEKKKRNETKKKNLSHHGKLFFYISLVQAYIVFLF